MPPNLDGLTLSLMAQRMRMALPEAHPPIVITADTKLELLPREVLTYLLEQSAPSKLPHDTVI